MSISSILIGAGFRLKVRSHRSDPSVIFLFLVTPGQKVEAQSVLCRLRESCQQILGSVCGSLRIPNSSMMTSGTVATDSIYSLRVPLANASTGWVVFARADPLGF